MCVRVYVCREIPRCVRASERVRARARSVRVRMCACPV